MFSPLEFSLPAILARRDRPLGLSCGLSSRTREGILIQARYQTCPHRVVPNILRHLLFVFFSAQDVVVVAALPQWLAPSPLEPVPRDLLEPLHERNEPGVSRSLQKYVEMIRHEAICQDVKPMLAGDIEQLLLTVANDILPAEDQQTTTGVNGNHVRVGTLV